MGEDRFENMFKPIARKVMGVMRRNRRVIISMLMLLVKKMFNNNPNSDMIEMEKINKRFEDVFFVNELDEEAFKVDCDHEVGGRLLMGHL